MIATTIRELRRAPGRAAASILAMGLAIAAIGVLGVPAVASSSLRGIAAEDRLAHIALQTDPITDPGTETALGAIEGVDSVELRTAGTLELPGAAGEQLDEGLLVVGARPDATVDRVRVESGRYPTAAGEVLVPPELIGAATGVSLGEQIEVPGPTGPTPVSVVGTGRTARIADRAVAFALPDTASALTGSQHPNTVLVRLDEPDEANLELALEAIRAELASTGVALRSFPEMLADGAHPIEEEITEVAFMIGSLGVLAGVVALVLLSSTANAIVTARSRDAAVMRALGARSSTARRDLSRPAIAIGAAAVVVGVPLGVAISNAVARMVLERFAGITPGIAVAPAVVLASACFGLLGARIAAGRVARRVARTDLQSALRDRDALAFGRRLGDRILAAVPTGGLRTRVALRSMSRRRSRTVGLGAQFAGGVAAVVLVASLASSVAAFNEAELESFRWEAATSPVDPQSPYSLDAGASDPDTEVALTAEGTVGDWELEVIGVDPATDMVDTGVTAGRWLPGTDDTLVRSGAHRPVVLAERFAEQEGYGIGDELVVDLAGGPASFEVVGLHPVRSVAAFVPAEGLAELLGTPGSGNTLWTRNGAEPAPLGSMATTTTSREDLFAQDAAARDAILAVFAAIGTIVVAISAIGIASTVAIDLDERRGEFTTMQACGARRRDVTAVVATEVGILAVVGSIAGCVLGGIGASAIMASFASSNAVELGFTMAWTVVPLAAAGAVALALLLAVSAGGRMERGSLEQTLRAAT